MSANQSASERVRAIRVGLTGAGLWLLIEFGIRDIGLVAILGLALITGRQLDLGQLMIGNIVLLWPAMLVAGLVFLRIIRQRGLTSGSLGYRPWRSAILPGLIAAAIAWGLIYAIHDLSEHVFGTRDVDQFMQAEKAAGLPIMIVGLLPANGVFGPVVEELAWRGYIQPHLIRGWGPRVGIAVTALLFALKHVIVDLSYSRVFALLPGSFLLGVVGYRWGTSASTIAHVVLNSLATVSAILEIWHQ